MSTKIYDGLKFKAKTIEELFPKIMELRKNVQNIVKKNYYRCIGNTVTFIIDEELLGKRTNSSEKHSPLSLAINSIDERRNHLKKTGIRDPEVDFDFSIVLFIHETGIYGIPFCDNKDILQSFLDMDLATPFGYWDNVDPDEECSEEEWEVRKKVWSDLIPGYEPTCNYGLTAEIYSNTSYIDYPSANDILPFVTKTEKRIINNTIQQLTDQFFSEISSDSNKNTASHFLTAHSRAIKEKNENSDIYLKLKQEVEKKLIPITKEMILGK